MPRANDGPTDREELESLAELLSRPSDNDVPPEIESWLASSQVGPTDLLDLIDVILGRANPPWGEHGVRAIDERLAELLAGGGLEESLLRRAAGPRTVAVKIPPNELCDVIGVTPVDLLLTHQSSRRALGLANRSDARDLAGRIADRMRQEVDPRECLEDESPQVLRLAHAAHATLFICDVEPASLRTFWNTDHAVDRTLPIDGPSLASLAAETRRPISFEEDRHRQERTDWYPGSTSWEPERTGWSLDAMDARRLGEAKRDRRVLALPLNATKGLVGVLEFRDLRLGAPLTSGDVVVAASFVLPLANLMRDWLRAQAPNRPRFPAF